MHIKEFVTWFLSAVGLLAFGVGCDEGEAFPEHANEAFYCGDHFVFQADQDRCVCADGYELLNESERCIDIDECAASENPCGAGRCINTNGGYACECPSDLLLIRDVNGHESCDIDHCKNENPCGAGRCANDGLGSYTCDCNTGYTAERSEKGTTCVDIDECAASDDLCGFGQCVNTEGSYTCDCGELGVLDSTGKQCVCKSGYREQNGSCVDIDECAETAFLCGGGGNCVNLLGSYTCDCYDDWVLVELYLVYGTIFGDYYHLPYCYGTDECIQDNQPCGEDACNYAHGPDDYRCYCEEGIETRYRRCAAIYNDEKR